MVLGWRQDPTRDAHGRAKRPWSDRRTERTGDEFDDAKDEDGQATRRGEPRYATVGRPSKEKKNSPRI